MIQLEKISQNDYSQLISWVDNKETLLQFAGPAYIFPLTPEQLDESLSDRNRIAFKAIEMQSEEFIGYGEIYVTENSARLGRIIIGEKEFRGKGFGYELVRQLIEYSSIILGRSKIELNVFDWNTAAINCYKKAGFIFNPEKKYERIINGEVWTALNMVLEIKAESSK